MCCVFFASSPSAGSSAGMGRPSVRPRSRFVPGSDQAGTLVGLWGHIARSNPQVESLRRDPRAEILILGANGYISPSWMADRTQAPTWNYASVQVLANIAFIEDDAGTRAGPSRSDRRDGGRAAKCLEHGRHGRTLRSPGAAHHRVRSQHRGNQAEIQARAGRAARRIRRYHEGARGDRGGQLRRGWPTSRTDDVR